MDSVVNSLNKDKQKQKDQAKLKKRIKAGLDIDYNKVFSTPEGIRVLNDILTNTHIFGLSFSFNGKDQTDFREGERNIGLKLTKTMRRVNKQALFSAFDINLKQEYKTK